MSNKLKKYLLPLLLAAMPTAYFKESEGKGVTENQPQYLSPTKKRKSFML